jgi:hypothetical protein
MRRPEVSLQPAIPSSTRVGSLANSDRIDFATRPVPFGGVGEMASVATALALTGVARLQRRGLAGPRPRPDGCEG